MKQAILLCVLLGWMSCELQKVNDMGPATGPTAQFTISNNNCTAPCDITFVNQSEDAVIYDWDFGDGSQVYNATSDNVSHQYTRGGTFTVKLTAKDADGNGDQVTQEVTVNFENWTSGPHGLVLQADRIIEIVQLNNGDYIFYGFGLNQFYKFNERGEEIDNAVDNNPQITPYSLFFSQNGFLYASGQNEVNGPPEPGYVKKFNQSFIELETQEYTDSGNPDREVYFSSSVQSMDGDLFFAGSSGEEETYIRRVPVSSFPIGGSTYVNDFSSDCGQKMVDIEVLEQFSDGAFVGVFRQIGGNRYLFRTTVNDITDIDWCINVDMHPNAVIEANNGWIVAVGEKDGKPWIIEYSTSGAPQHNEQFRYFDGEIRDIDLLLDGNYVVTGWWDADPAGTQGKDVYVASINSDSFEVEWERKYGGAHNDSGDVVLTTQDGGIIVAAQIGEANGIWAKAHVYKLDDRGQME